MHIPDMLQHTRNTLKHLALAVAVGAGLWAGSARAVIATDAVVTTATITNGTSLTIAKPSGVVAGDVMIVTIAQRQDSSGAAAAAGWTLIKNGTLGSGSRMGTILYKAAGASEPTDYTFTLAPTINNQVAIGAIVAFSGVDIGSPVEAAGASFTVGNPSGTYTGPGITTISADAAVVMLGMAAYNSGTAPTASGWTTTSPGALTELFDNQAVNGVYVASVGAAWAIKPSPGATGNGTATLSASQRNGGYLIALRPATPPAIAANSTVAAFPTSVQADGATTSTITVTLKDGSNVAVAGKTVTLASDRNVITPGTDTISAASGLSDANGVVTFTVKSTTIGSPVFTATNVSDAFDVGTASVTYTVSSANDFVSFGPGAMIDTVNAKVLWPQTPGTNLSNLTPIYTVSPNASGDPASGPPARDFSTPQIYTITAQDGTKKDYTVSAYQSGYPITVNFSWPATEPMPAAPLSGPAASTAYWTDVRPASSPATGSNLVNSHNEATTVGFSFGFESRDPWGSPTLAMLKTALFNNGNCEISGLTAGHVYHLYIASYYPNENGSKAKFTMANAPYNGASLIVDNGGGSGTPPAGSNTAWIINQNYGFFGNLVPNASNKITFSYTQAPFPAGQNPKAMINGFQLVDVTFAPPPAPTNLAAIPHIGAIELNWTASFGATSYVVKRATSSGEEVELGTATATTFTDTVTPGVPYFYVVTAVNAAGENLTPSNEVTATALSSTTTLTLANPAVTTKPYDSTATATITGTLVGVAEGDQVFLVGTGTFASANVGTNIGVTANCTLSGANASSYVLTQPTDLTGEITPAALTVKADNHSRTVGIPNPDLTYTVSGYQGADNAASVGLSAGQPELSTDAVLASPEGSYPITCTAGGVTITDTNYMLAFVDGQLLVLGQLTWAAGNGAWDIGSSVNWTAATLGAVTYQEGVTVSFDDTAAGSGACAVTLDTTVNPASVTVNNPTRNYTISGTGKIGGAGTLTKDGNGTLTLGGVNTYSGGTIVNAGSFQLQSGYSSVAGTLTMADATLFKVAADPAATVTNAIELTGGHVTVAIPFGGATDIALTGTISGAGGMIVASDTSGRGLTLSGSGNNFAGGVLFKDDGGSRVALGHVNALGTGVFTSEKSGAGQGVLQATTDLSGGSGVPNPFAIAAGKYLNIDNNNNLKLSGPITGATGKLYKSGSATLTLAGINTYGGNTTVSAGILVLADNAQLTFVLGATSSVCNSISGDGIAVLDGDFAIDTAAAAALTEGTWTLEHVTSLTGAYGDTFRVVDFTDAGNNQWTKHEPGKIWTYDETTGTLTLAAGSNLQAAIISGVTASQAIPVGNASVLLQGTVSDGGTVYPAEGETVTITIGTASQETTIVGETGDFSVLFLTGSIPASSTPYTITYSYAGNGTTLDAATPNTSTTLTVNSTYLAWIEKYFPTPGDPKAEPGADPDKDGKTNQDEYAFGLNPNSATSVDPITQQLNKTTGIFRYTRQEGTGLNYLVYTSGTLANDWALDGSAGQELISTSPEGVQTVQVTLSGSKPLAATRLFVRVKATPAP
jgi:autotransporter-associated beta strand protein